MSQKIENQLNLALSITEEERQKSESLDIGYDLEEKRMGIDREVFRDVRASKNTSCLCDGTDRWICHYPNKKKVR